MVKWQKTLENAGSLSGKLLVQNRLLKSAKNLLRFLLEQHKNKNKKALQRGEVCAGVTGHLVCCWRPPLQPTPGMKQLNLGVCCLLYLKHDGVWVFCPT